MLFSKVQGIVNIKFQIYRSNDSVPITGDDFISLSDIYSDIGFFPRQIFITY